MKKFILTLTLICTVNFFFGQEAQEINTFQKSENVATGTKSAAGTIGGEQTEDTGPGNLPGDEEIPIDDYLPVLAISALVIMVYQYKMKNRKIVK
ncbi:hypothetical protein [Cloacibacterium caeni]|uniref:hypothetical protein n=1 Tax=Cloacibacterium caeni TaxID=2004710 RepID=UPI001BD17EB0|nr:hypothetical protein [Cloacibacterium caeni]